MGDLYIKKGGLLYSPDGKSILGVDDTATGFSGHVTYGAKYIDDEVFSDCPYVSVVLPDSICELGVALFKDSKNLESVKLPVYVTQLPVELFSGCSSLKKVIMPNEIIGFSEGLFKGCKSLVEIPFRTGVKILPRSVFEGCTSLKSLVIPESVESIEANAVANCTGLESLVLPDTIKSINKTAFSGCTSLHNIRICGSSDIFYINDEDGSLYKKTIGNGELIIKSYKVDPSYISFFSEDVDSEPVEESEEDEYENEDVFSAEIGAAETEAESIGLINEDEQINDVNKSEKVDIEGYTMSEDNNIDSMLADIMGEEKERTSVSENVGVSEAESEVLSETLSVMEDSSMSNGAAVSNDELEKLFSKNEEQEIAAQNNDEEKKDKNELDSKTKILVDAAEVNKILLYDVNDDGKSDSDLFVVAEKLVDGNSFSKHLEACCAKMARIHDFSRVVMLYGLPVDNDEFMQFYRHFMGKRNIILACEAEKPSNLSDYCKVVCDNSRIRLDSKEINEQRKYASVKTETLVKLVVRDKYDA